MKSEDKKINYQLVLDETLNNIENSGRVPALFLHACCAPCSSYVLEYLSQYFSITVFFYNPNIYPESEYEHRAAEIAGFINRFPVKHEVRLISENYDPSKFYETVKGLEELGEGSERCYKCYELRLSESARMAAELGFDYFTTTLSISPMKNAAWLNEIGRRLSEEYGVSYLYSDFKKRNGFKRSTEISAEYGMYRQDYCGCVFSYNERHNVTGSERLLTN